MKTSGVQIVGVYVCTSSQDQGKAVAAAETKYVLGQS